MAAPERPVNSSGNPAELGGQLLDVEHLLTLQAERNGRFESDIAANTHALETMRGSLAKTIDKLAESVQQQLAELDRRLSQLIGAEAEMRRAGIDSTKETLSMALNAAATATNKAETATEKRFDSVNEFRAQLKDQSMTFLPRVEAEQRLSQLATRLEELRTSDAQRTAHSAGSTALYGWVIGGIGALATILVIINSIISK
jgi:tetrahydromethanopterin S-methyltransferase subunit G